MKNHKKGYPLGLTRLAAFTAILVLSADQISKEIVRRFLEGGAAAILPSFNLVSAWNRGVAFSLFRQDGAGGKWILIIASLAICVFLARWLRQAETWLTALGIGLILGGALGNILDRLRFSAVFDFVDLYWGTYHWPAFNLADSAIVTGVACLLFHGLFPGAKGAKSGHA